MDDRVPRGAKLAEGAPDEPEVDAAHDGEVAVLDGQERAGPEVDGVVAGRDGLRSEPGVGEDGDDDVDRSGDGGRG